MPITCKLGFHDWERIYLNTNSCQMVERCSKCDAVNGKAIIMHNWEQIQCNPCLSQQVCKHCGEIGQIDEKGHLWEELYTSNNYEIQKTCRLC
jgi:hypothetical protein